MKKEQIILLVGVLVVVVAAFAFVSANGLLTARVAPSGWTQMPPQQQASPSPYCGDGVCASTSGETSCSCPQDCQTPACGSSWGNLIEVWEARTGHVAVVHNGKMFV